MIRSIIGGAVAAALLSAPAFGAPTHTVATPRSAAPRPPPAPAWVITPTETGCRVDLELVARSGAITPISLISDGQLTSLRFFKEDLPARAFLPLRVDKARFSSLMLRGDGGAGELVLSEETEAAMRKGTTLSVAWLTEEPLSVALAGSEQGMVDLKTCGAQASRRHGERTAADQAARDRAQAEARAKAVADAQLAAINAQTAAAEAQRRQVEAAAERDRQEALDRQRRADAEVQSRAYEEARQRAYDDDQAARRRTYERQAEEEDDDPRWAPAPPPRTYYPPQPYFPRPRYAPY